LPLCSSIAFVKDLFDFLNQLAGQPADAARVPLIFGLFTTHTRLVRLDHRLGGRRASWLLSKYVSPEIFQHWLGWTKPLTCDEATYLKSPSPHSWNSSYCSAGISSPAVLSQSAGSRAGTHRNIFLSIFNARGQEGVGGVQTGGFTNLIGSLLSRVWRVYFIARPHSQ